MVDEAYFHFYGESTLPGREQRCRTWWWRAYVFEGLRPGQSAHWDAGCGPARLIGFLRKVSSPYNVNGVALSVLPEALEDGQYLDWYVVQVHQGRERMQEALHAMGVRTWPSAANFVLMDIGARHKELCAAMRRRAGVLFARPLVGPGLRRVCAHHHWTRRACDARHRSPAGIARGDRLDRRRTACTRGGLALRPR